MWNISSDNIQRAREQIEVRRSEIETRYAEGKQALDAELAVVEALERAASEFMLRHARNGSAGASEPAAPLAAAGDSRERSDGEDGGGEAEAAQRRERGDGDGGLEATAMRRSAESDPAGAGETAPGLDILKPGSRWRLYRGISRPTDSEGVASEAVPSAE